MWQKQSAALFRFGLQYRPTLWGTTATAETAVPPHGQDAHATSAASRAGGRVGGYFGAEDDAGGVEFFFRREGHGGAVEQVVEVVVQETEDGLGCIQRATVLISHQQTRALMPFDALDQALGAEETEFFVAPDAGGFGVEVVGGEGADGAVGEAEGHGGGHAQAGVFGVAIGGLDGLDVLDGDAADVFDHARGVDGGLANEAAVDSFIVRAAVVVGVGFLREDLDDLADRAFLDDFPHRHEGLGEGGAGHFVEGSAGALGGGENPVQFHLAHRAGFFGVDILAGLEAGDRLIRLFGPHWGTERHEAHAIILQQFLQARVVPHIMQFFRGILEFRRFAPGGRDDAGAGMLAQGLMNLVSEEAEDADAEHG